MPDEQIIYLDPNDDLNLVREKLEKYWAQRITIIVPQQTQLRSHTGWRLIHARVRELRIEVQVISADRQVRAVARTAGFRVSESLESSSSGKKRTLSGPSSRVTQRGRIPPRRGSINRSYGDNSLSRIDETRTSIPDELTIRPNKEDEEDPFLQDYETSQRIRADAQGIISPFPPSHFTMPPESIHTNPFEEDIEELSPSFLPEQRGASDISYIDIAPDVADIPIQAHQIEDIVEPIDSQDFPVRQWDNEFLDQPDEDFPAYNDTKPPNRRRSGKLRPNRFYEDDEDFMPPSDQSILPRTNRSRPVSSLKVSKSNNRNASSSVAPKATRQKGSTQHVPLGSSAKKIASQLLIIALILFILIASISAFIQISIFTLIFFSLSILTIGIILLI